MLSQTESYKSLASAILLRALVDIRKNYFDVSFFMSEWCFDLCSIAGIVYSLYFKKAMEEGHKLKDPLHVAELAYRL